jgi:hypothetical protein
MEVEMGEELRDGEVLEPGRVVGHAVGGAVDVGVFLAVAVVALVEAGHAAEVGGGSSSGDGTFVLAGEGGCVIREVGEGEFPEVEGLGGDVGACDEGGLFEVAVGEIAVRVGGGDDAGLDVRWKGDPPDQRGMSVDEDNPAHTGFGGIDRLKSGGLLGEELGEACWAGAEVLREAFEVIQVVADELGDAHTVRLGFGDAQLEGAKEAGASRDTNAHEAELAEVTLPLSKADAVLAAEVVKDGLEAQVAVGWELEGAEDCVEDPAEDELAGVPGAVSLEELLDGGGLIATLVADVGLVQHQVDGMEDVAAHVAELAAAALADPEEVVDEDVGFGEGPRSGRVGRLLGGCRQGRRHAGASPGGQGRTGGRLVGGLLGERRPRG